MQVGISGRLSKFSTPSSAYWLPRTRLFNAIDHLLDANVIWISAPAGCGKTVLVASYLHERKQQAIWYRIDSRDADLGSFFYFLREACYQAGLEYTAKLPLLTAEYAGGEEVYARNFCEALFAGMSDGVTLVLDDFQELPESSLTQLLLPVMLECIPDGKSVFILSRERPPARLARLSVNQQMDVVTEAQLRFTLTETQELIDSWHGSSGITQDADTLFQLTQGWAAGTVLTLRGENRSALQREGDDNSIFDYLATELLVGLDETTRNLLLSTALLPQFDIGLASGLCNTVDVTTVLDELVRRNLFVYVEEGGIYHYHPLFRRLLLRLGEKEWSKSHLNALRNHAAELLLARKAPELALPLLEAADAWPRFTEILLGCAQAMVVQGRHNELEDWLRRLPAEVQDGMPWVIFWQATVLLPSRIDEAHQMFVKAYDAFWQCDIRSGVILAWIGGVDSVIYSLNDIPRLDFWLQYFDTLRQRYPAETNGELQGQLAMRAVSAMMLRQPDHPDLQQWWDWAEQSLRRIDDVNQRIMGGFYLCILDIWRGELDRAAELIEGLLPDRQASLPPLAYTTYQMARAYLAWSSGDYEACRKAVDLGLAKAEACGVFVWYGMLAMQGASNAIIHGRSELSEPYHARLVSRVIEARDMDRAYLYIDTAWLELNRNNLLQSLEYAQRAIKAAELSAYYTRALAYGCMAQVQHELGNDAMAVQYLQQAREIGLRYKSWTLLWQCALAEAQFTLAQGDESSAVKQLSEIFSQANVRGVVTFNGWRPAVIAQLCALALKHNINPGLVHSIVQRFHLPTPVNAPYDWPWPLRVFTLGRFSVLRGDQPIRFESRAQKKPFELLKVLLAKGGRDVGEATLTETLWPDAEGDAAHSAFSTTLSRLRKLLGQDSLVFRDGKLSLNNSACWVDAWTVERGLKQIDHLVMQHQSNSEIDASIDQVLSLYQGDFLQAESSAWVLNTRERIKGKVLAAIKKVIAASVDCYRVIALYEKALLLDPLSEESYRGLMVCLAMQGNPAHACALYERCQTILYTTFGIQPSETTRQLAEAITRQEPACLQQYCSVCQSKA